MPRLFYKREVHGSSFEIDTKHEVQYTWLQQYRWFTVVLSERRTALLLLFPYMDRGLLRDKAQFLPVHQLTTLSNGDGLPSETSVWLGLSYVVLVSHAKVEYVSHLGL